MGLKTKTCISVINVMEFLGNYNTIVLKEQMYDIKQVIKNILLNLLLKGGCLWKGKIGT